jgi:hypothetical protein
MELGQEVRRTERPPRDVILSEQGSVSLLSPTTGAGRAWIDEHIGPHNQPYYPVVVAEPHHVLSIVRRMRTDGLNVDPPERGKSP